MKRIVSIILGIMIFAIPCFAFASDPVWVNGESSGVLPVYPSTLIFPSTNNQSGTETVYINVASNSDDHPVYYFYDDLTNSHTKIVFWSDYPVSVDFSYTIQSSGDTTNLTYNLTKDSESGVYYNGVHGFWMLPSFTYSPLIESDNVLDALHFAVSSNPTPDNDVLYTIYSIVNGATSWLSAVVDGVLQAPMLLFLILIPFIGIAVGLLFRFRRG